MRKWKQRLCGLLLCGAMLTSLCAPAAADKVASGDLPSVDGTPLGNGNWTVTACSPSPLPLTSSQSPC